jgi:hypothetical protein
MINPRPNTLPPEPPKNPVVAQIRYAIEEEEDAETETDLPSCCMIRPFMLSLLAPSHHKFRPKKLPIFQTFSTIFSRIFSKVFHRNVRLYFFSPLSSSTASSTAVEIVPYPNENEF